MVLLNHLTHLGVLQSLKLSHLQLVCRPVFNAAVFGNYLEHSNQPVRLEVDYAARLANLNLTQRTVPAAVRVNLAVAFQLRKPDPTKATNSLEVVETRVPAIKQHRFGRKASLFGLHQHLAKMIVLRSAVCGLVKQAVVARDVSLTIGPKQSDEIYPHDDLPMFARPVAGNKADLPGVLLIERRVIENQYARFKFNLLMRFLL